ncbi:MAG: small, acid-soluble spore protein, alpha/beta type [Clostridia bacterium]
MTNNSNKSAVPEAREALNKFKYEVASDMCVKNIFKHYLLATSFFYLCYFLF